MFTLPERFTAKIVVDDSTGCHLWTAAKTRNGYGQFRLNGRVQRAHRVAYESAYGPIPDGMYLDHLCRNRACVRPDHLEPVTHAENLHRGMDARNGSRDVCPQGHELSGENLVPSDLKRGKRTCAACHREHTEISNAVASALGKAWGIGSHPARRDPRVKTIVRDAYNWSPASDAEAAEVAAELDALNRIESGQRLTKRQKIAAVYRPPA